MLDPKVLKAMELLGITRAQYQRAIYAIHGPEIYVSNSTRARTMTKTTTIQFEFEDSPEVRCYLASAFEDDAWLECDLHFPIRVELLEPGALFILSKVMQHGGQVSTSPKRRPEITIGKNAGAKKQ